MGKPRAQAAQVAQRQRAHLPVQEMQARSQAGKDPWGGHGTPLQCSCLGKSHGQRCLAGYSPWGRKRVGHDLATEQPPTEAQQIFLGLVHARAACLYLLAGVSEFRPSVHSSRIPETQRQHPNDPIMSGPVSSLTRWPGVGA